jgi:hypothetical protein
MSGWIDKLRQDHQQNKRHVEETSMVRDAAQLLMPAVLKQIEKDLRYFSQQFTDHRKFRGPERTSTGAWFLITDRFPACSLEYRISETAVEFERESWANSESPKQRQSGTIWLKADIDKGVWFEHEGERFLCVEDVSRFLLEDFLQKMIES